MAMQERAARTRGVLMRAAAGVFDSEGYAATRARVSGAAGLSLGALTFHFPMKEDLADAVQAAGSSAVRGALRGLPFQRGALPASVALTIEMAWLMETDVMVRAAARLSRERPGEAAHWDAVWRPTLERLLQRAADGELRPAADPRLVFALAEGLVAGAEARIRAAGAPPATCENSTSVWLADIWQLVLPALTADEPGDGSSGDGSGGDGSSGGGPGGGGPGGDAAPERGGRFDGLRCRRWAAL
jgi:AcrR family transcriptional regulator